MADWYAVQGDSGPGFLDTIKHADGTPVNLNSCTVVFQMRSLTAPAPVALTGTTTVLDPTAGTIQFTPTSSDTAVPGDYMATWQVTFSSGVVMTVPTQGYNSVQILENLITSTSQQLVGLPDLKDYLNMPSNDRTHDAKLIRLIHSVRPVVEMITGPIIPTVYEEWHDGGQSFIQVRRRPSTGYGTTPILDLIGIDEYRGPIKYNLLALPDPGQGSIYSVHMDRLGKITRRSAGGGVIGFPNTQESIHVWYRAGQSSIPHNVYEGTLELLRIHYQTTMAAGPGRRTPADTYNNEPGKPMGFFVPGSVRERLAPTRRAPAIA